MSTPTSTPVVHNTDEHRFEISVAGALAHMDYERSAGRLAITHTFVPPELRGRGLAEQLMQATLAFAQQEGLAIDPVCSYAARYLEKHSKRA